MLQTQEYAKLVASQVLDSGVDDAPGICKHRSGHELFWLVHHVSLVDWSTVLGLMV